MSCKSGDFSDAENPDKVIIVHRALEQGQDRRGIKTGNGVFQNSDRTVKKYPRNGNKDKRHVPFLDVHGKNQKYKRSDYYKVVFIYAS